MISAWENLHFATLELVRSTPIKQRLIAAYRRHLTPCRGRAICRAEVRGSFAQVMRSSRRSCSRCAARMPWSPRCARCPTRKRTIARHSSSRSSARCAGRMSRARARAPPSCNCAASIALTGGIRSSRRSSPPTRRPRRALSIELELDRIPARRLLMARLAPQGIDQSCARSTRSPRRRDP